MGGAVRDLLIGRAPQGFDVATSATPDQVRSFVPQLPLIGRLFRSRPHHVCQEIIEVLLFAPIPTMAAAIVKPKMADDYFATMSTAR